MSTKQHVREKRFQPYTYYEENMIGIDFSSRNIDAINWKISESYSQENMFLLKFFLKNLRLVTLAWKLVTHQLDIYHYV